MCTCFCCVFCSACSCLTNLFVGYFGKIIIIIISVFTICMGGLLSYGFFWTTYQTPYKTIISVEISALSRGIALSFGIAMIIFGICGIFGIIYNPRFKGKLHLFIYYIGSIIIFIAMLFLGITILIIMANSSAVDDYLCSKSNKLPPIEMYDNIKAKTTSSMDCPSNCPGSSSLKLADCPYYQSILNVSTSTFSRNYFEILEELETTFNCSGICNSQRDIPCQYFNNISKKNFNHCISIIREKLSQYKTNAIVIFSVAEFILLLNVFAASTILCSNK